MPKTLFIDSSYRSNKLQLANDFSIILNQPVTVNHYIKLLHAQVPLYFKS